MCADHGGWKLYIQLYFNCQPANLLTRTPVNSRGKSKQSKYLRRPPYIHGRLAAASDSPKITHALYASISRRTACPASGFGSGGPPRQIEEGGKGVEGAVAVPAGEVAVVHGQRPEGILPRLLLRQARRHHLVPDGDRGRRFCRGGGTSRRDGRRAAAGSDPRCRASRAAPQDAVRCDGAISEILRRHFGLAQRSESARLSRRPRDFAGRAVAVSHRLCLRRALCAEGVS